MRLLQLATAPDRLIDLHPNVTVLSGLDDGERRLLADTVMGLARGTAPDRLGLLEAHGLLFDLSDDMLALLDVSAEGLRPLVTAADLPSLRLDANARERIAAERALDAIDERSKAAEEHQRRLQLAHTAATEALELARRSANDAEAGAAERPRLIDELTAQREQLDERRRHLQDEHAERVREAERATARKSEVEAATADVRVRHEETAILCSELAGRLDQARLGLDPDSEAEAEAARVELARVKAEVKAERAAEAPSGEAEPEGEEPPAERFARVQARIEELEKRLAAFAPTEIFDVSNALEDLQARSDELIPSQEAETLADEIAALDDDLNATSRVRPTVEGLAAGRARLDDARHALVEAEQAAKPPELDREMVDRLEVAHAELLDAIERADGRFSGSRADRRVEAARTAEQVLLDALGFVSYADYMIGYSLLVIDPLKEDALDAARDELAAAEDEWRVLQAETEAELARAERMEERRLLLRKARTLLGRPVAADAAVDELRALRVPATVPRELVDGLQHGLDRAGIAVAGEQLGRAELVKLAEAWLVEAHDARAREQGLHDELVGLAEERAVALAAMDAVAATGPSGDEERKARLSAARAAVKAADERHRLHREAEALVDSIAAELVAAVEAGRLAADEASGAEPALAEATGRAEQLSAEVVRIAEELQALDKAKVEADEQLRSLSDPESASPEQLALQVTEAEAALSDAEARLAEGSASLRDLAVLRTETRALLASFGEQAEPLDDRSLAEEIEWYLLARLAAQRAVCLGGSLPLLLDDALDGLDEEQLGHVLGRLERMADAVQVIVISDDPLAASWALMAGQDRAAVVRPQPA